MRILRRATKKEASPPWRTNPSAAPRSPAPPPVKGVLSYGEPVKNRGLNLLSAPGNDLVASTALAASGAQIVLFTTGRGTPFASPVPTVKISSNTPLYEKKKNWIDFNCGALLEGTSLSDLSEQLFDYVLRVRRRGAGQIGSGRFPRYGDLQAGRDPVERREKRCFSLRFLNAACGGGKEEAGKALLFPWELALTANSS